MRRPNCALNSSNNSRCSSTGFLVLRSLTFDFIVNRPPVLQRMSSESAVWKRPNERPAVPAPHQRRPFHTTSCPAEFLPQSTPDFPCHYPCGPRPVYGKSAYQEKCGSRYDRRVLCVGSSRAARLQSVEPLTGRGQPP